MDLVKLRRHEHPAPPQHELRGRMVLDSRDRECGDIEALYVDREERKARLMEIASGGFMGIGKKHHLVPVEAIDDETPGAVHLSVSEEAIKASPEFDPHGEIGEELMRAVYEHYGYPVPRAGDHQPA